MIRFSKLPNNYIFIRAQINSIHTPAIIITLYPNISEKIHFNICNYGAKIIKIFLES